MNSSLVLKVFGEFVARCGERSLKLPLRKAQALLTYLAMRPGQPVSRDKLASLLWSTSGTEQARQSLRQTLFSIRKELAGTTVLSEEGDYLRLTGAEVDALTFTTLAASGNLSEAAAMYAGPFLAGFTIHEERFDHWVSTERQRLQDSAVEAHRALMSRQMNDGESDAALATGRRVLELDPLQEGVYRSMMRLHILKGDRNGALQHYDSCARVLRRELRIDPDHDTRRLQGEADRIGIAASSGGQEPRSILVVEDNMLSRQLANAVLSQAGHRVVLAKDGAEALMLLGKEKIDLMILDVDLPYLDGHSLLRAAQQNGIDAPAIFMSGLPGEDVEIKAFELGAADFIRKPVRNQVLLSRISSALRVTRVA